MGTFNKRNVLILTFRDLLKLSLNLEPSRPGSEVQDWVKCRDWLALPQVTPYSARTTKISKVASERELYNYLKVGVGSPAIIIMTDSLDNIQDGIELCRIVGLLTKEIIPDGIIYRTQNLRFSYIKCDDFRNTYKFLIITDILKRIISLFS